MSLYLSAKHSAWTNLVYRRRKSCLATLQKYFATILNTMLTATLKRIRKRQRLAFTSFPSSSNQVPMLQRTNLSGVVWHVASRHSGNFAFALCSPCSCGLLTTAAWLALPSLPSPDSAPTGVFDLCATSSAQQSTRDEVQVFQWRAFRENTRHAWMHRLWDCSNFSWKNKISRETSQAEWERSTWSPRLGSKTGSYPWARIGTRGFWSVALSANGLVQRKI